MYSNNDNSGLSLFHFMIILLPVKFTLVFLYIVDNLDVTNQHLFPHQVLFPTLNPLLYETDNSRQGKCLEINGHKLVPTYERKQKLCRYCRVTGQKSPSGRGILTRSMCQTCDVPLCMEGITERNCFRLYHEHFVFNKSIIWIWYMPSFFMNEKIYGHRNCSTHSKLYYVLSLKQKWQRKWNRNIGRWLKPLAHWRSLVENKLISPPMPYKSSLPTGKVYGRVYLR